MATAYILNRVPSKSVPSTPYELWSGKKPDLSNLRPWGCAGYVHNATHKHGKLGPRANKYVFIRYSDESKGYVMLGEHPDGGVTEIVSCDVEFMENDFPSKGDVGQNLELYKMVESWDDTPAINPGDSGREITPSGSDHNHKKMTPKAHNCAEVSVEMFHANALELKGNPSLMLRKMTRSLGHMMRLCHPLHAMNG
jgi:hypothetical protein